MASTVLPNGIIIPEKYSRDWYNDLYHNWQELDNLLGGGTPKDGTLTIQKNGDTVGTFSANQATNETVNIEVPTKTSDLNNDSGFITGVAWDDVTNKPSFATVATSGSYNDLSNKPTIPTVNDATLTIQRNGTDVQTFTANQSTNATANITVPTKTSDLTNDSGFITSDNTKIPLAGSNQISGSLIPSTDGTVNLGGPSYQWNNAYIKSLTINGVACGDILTHNESEFVPRSGGAVITGTAFSKNVDNSEFRIDGGSSWNKGGSVTVYGKDRTDENGKVVLHASDGNNETYFSFYPNGYIALGSNFSFNTNVTFQIGSSGGIYFQLRYDGMVWSNSNRIYPANNLVMGLGDSTHKWKSINGIAPDELGLPTSTYTDVSSYITNFDNTANTFTAPASGILQIDANGKTVVDDAILVVNAVENDGSYRSIMPVAAGDTVTIYTLASSVSAIIHHLKGKI